MVEALLVLLRGRRRRGAVAAAGLRVVIVVGLVIHHHVVIVIVIGVAGAVAYIVVIVIALKVEVVVGVGALVACVCAALLLDVDLLVEQVARGLEVVLVQVARQDEDVDVLALAEGGHDDVLVGLDDHLVVLEEDVQRVQVHGAHVPAEHVDAVHDGVHGGFNEGGLVQQCAVTAEDLLNNQVRVAVNHETFV